MPRGGGASSNLITESACVCWIAAFADDDDGDWPILWRTTVSGGFPWVQAHSRLNDRSVERQAGGSLEGEFAYDNGDDATLKAKPR